MAVLDAATGDSLNLSITIREQDNHLESTVSTVIINDSTEHSSISPSVCLIADAIAVASVRAS